MLGTQKATPRLKSVQLAALAMLVGAGVINYIDRATLAVANPLIREEPRIWTRCLFRRLP
jgi:hypothetical protein